MKKKIIFIFQVALIYIFTLSISLADLQNKLINKLKTIETLSFKFKQKIAENEEIGNCLIKYPLLMKCNYQKPQKKIIISNGKTVAIIKKKYKKIYYYPLKTTPLFIILDKKKILELIKNNKPTKIDLNIIEFEFTNKKREKIKIFFDKNTLELKGWETKDSYSNNVVFIINELKINNQIVNDFFKIPKEENL